MLTYRMMSLRVMSNFDQSATRLLVYCQPIPDEAHDMEMRLLFRTHPREGHCHVWIRRCESTNRYQLSFGDIQQRWSKSIGTVCWSGKQVRSILCTNLTVAQHVT